jgi:hypothetical protein
MDNNFLATESPDRLYNKPLSSFAGEVVRACCVRGSTLQKLEAQ